MKGRAACPETFNQNINEFVYEYNLIKNEVFKYEINPPEEPKYSEEKEGISKSLFNENNSEKDQDSSNININNLQSKSVSQISEENSDYLEKKFKTDEKCAKYLIEGNDLLELYQLMKGMEYIYQSFSTSSIGISMINDKALFFSLSYENIQDTKSITHLSKNIKHITELTVKCVKNHYLTPFKYGFNSFYRSSLLSKFITSFFNKEDKRLLVKVSPSGKMILSFAFSDYKNEREEIPNQRENNKDISMEINENLEQNNNGSENNRNNMRRIRRDGLLDFTFNDSMIYYITNYDMTVVSHGDDMVVRNNDWNIHPVKTPYDVATYHSVSKLILSLYNATRDCRDINVLVCNPTKSKVYPEIYKLKDLHVTIYEGNVIIG